MKLGVLVLVVSLGCGGHGLHLTPDPLVTHALGLTNAAHQVGSTYWRNMLTTPASDPAHTLRYTYELEMWTDAFDALLRAEQDALRRLPHIPPPILDQITAQITLVLTRDLPRMPPEPRATALTYLVALQQVWVTLAGAQP